MPPFDPSAYGPLFAPLLETDRCRPLSAGDAAAPAALGDLTVEQAFAHTALRDRDMGACCLAGLWLFYDELDASHTISQQVETTSGSYWHAIMHRREGDFSNAKYWLRRVGNHPVYEALAAAVAAEASAEALWGELVDGGAWDADAMVDLCEAAERGRGGEGAALRAVQQAECELLFDYCYREACGG